MTKTRIEAFSDGVFAIAITLLVLTFVFGFLTIGVMWVDHHHPGMVLALFFSAFWHYGRLHVLRPDADSGIAVLYAVSNTFFGKERSG